MIYFRDRIRRDAEAEAESDEGSAEEESVMDKTKHKAEELEHQAEDIVAPVADKLHVKPWYVIVHLYEEFFFQWKISMAILNRIKIIND